MQVILLERIEKLGQMGDVVNVKPGYARNYLLPQHKARRATNENLADFEQQRVQLEADNLKRRDEARKVGEKLDGLAVVLIRQAGESGHLYGSVNARELAEAVTTAGFTVSRQQVELDAVIKSLGLHKAKIRLHPEVTVSVTANVARTDAEAAAQASAGHIISAEDLQAAVEAAGAEKEAALVAIEKEESEDETSAESESSESTSESKES
ncbi:MAG: 50S ribosomal protein L9 [Alphaproteobacteria bacterium]